MYLKNRSVSSPNNRQTIIIILQGKRNISFFPKIKREMAGQVSQVVTTGKSNNIENLKI